MDGGLTFGGYSSGKYLNDSSGKRRMAGGIFQKTFGDKGWNQEFLNTNGGSLNVDRGPALDYVAGKAKENMGNRNSSSNRPTNSSRSAVHPPESKTTRDQTNVIPHYDPGATFEERWEYAKSDAYREAWKQKEEAEYARAGVDNKEDYFNSKYHGEKRAAAIARQSTYKAEKAAMQAKYERSKSTG